MLQVFSQPQNLYFLVVGSIQMLTYAPIGVLPQYISPTGPFGTAGKGLSTLRFTRRPVVGDRLDTVLSCFGSMDERPLGRYEGELDGDNDCFLFRYQRRTGFLKR
jgi:hypothetical protein